MERFASVLWCGAKKLHWKILGMHHLGSEATWRDFQSWIFLLTYRNQRVLPPRVPSIMLKIPVTKITPTPIRLILTRTDSSKSFNCFATLKAFIAVWTDNLTQQKSAQVFYKRSLSTMSINSPTLLFNNNLLSIMPREQYRKRHSKQLSRRSRMFNLALWWFYRYWVIYGGLYIKW